MTLNDDTGYVPAVLDAKSASLVVTAWVAFAIAATIEWTGQRGGGWAALIVVAELISHLFPLWAAVRTREPMLGRPHWFPIASFVVISAASWAGLSCAR